LALLLKKALASGDSIIPLAQLLTFFLASLQRSDFSTNVALNSSASWKKHF